MALHPGEADPSPQPREKARWFLDRLLPTAADFDRFCLDYFDAVQRRFAGDMDRVARTNLLLELASVQEVLDALDEMNPTVFAKTETTWKQRRRPQSQTSELTLGNYRLLHELGRGAHATVYAAEHMVNGQRRAVKILHWQLGNDEKRREQFAQEARLSGRIRSQHAIQIIDSGVDGAGQMYLVMELLEGQTLTAYLDGARRLEPPQVLDICRQICHALSAAHREGIVHRDLKPDNIFLCIAAAQDYGYGPARIVKVLDFGIAKLVRDAGTDKTECLGTSAWMAPEQATLGAEISPATDLWAFGLLVFRMLVGHHYLRAAEAKAPADVVLREVLLDPLSHASQRAQEYGVADRLPPGPGFDAWFSRCVCRNVNERFLTAEAAFSALDGLLISPAAPLSLKPEVPPPPALQPDPPPPPAPQPEPPLPPAPRDVPAVIAQVPLAKPSTPKPPRALARRSILGYIALALGLFGIGYLALRNHSTPRVNPGPPVPACDQPGLTESERMSACEAACASRNAKESQAACKTLGTIYLTGEVVPKDVIKAVNRFDKACTAGEGSACFTIGQIYQSGDGVPKDAAIAVAMYGKACDGGSRTGCNSSGVLHEEGTGVPRDLAKAAALYRRACDGGEMTGCYNLAELYVKGAGVAKDAAKAVALYRQACDGGKRDGCLSLGFLYERGDGVQKDANKAATLYQQACDGGDMEGCNSLGWLYQKGEGVQRDADKAATLFRQTCDSRDMAGCNNLGFLYEKGDGVQKDAATAAALYQRACDGGELDACSSLGLMHEKGAGVPKDAGKAVAFYRKACDRNDKGCFFLAWMYGRGKGVAKDLTKAAALYQQACDGGEGMGCFNLGMSYVDGAGVAKSAVQAEAWFKRACDLNNKDGCQRLR